MADLWRNWLHHGPELRDDGRQIELLAADGRFLRARFTWMIGAQMKMATSIQSSW